VLCRRSPPTASDSPSRHSARPPTCHRRTHKSRGSRHSEDQRRWEAKCTRRQTSKSRPDPRRELQATPAKKARETERLRFHLQRLLQIGQHALGRTSWLQLALHTSTYAHTRMHTNVDPSAAGSGETRTSSFQAHTQNLWHTHVPRISTTTPAAKAGLKKKKKQKEKGKTWRPLQRARGPCHAE
jgi:hypothetical protein